MLDSQSAYTVAQVDKDLSFQQGIGMALKILEREPKSLIKQGAERRNNVRVSLGKQDNQISLKNRGRSRVKKKIIISVLWRCNKAVGSTRTEDNLKVAL